MACFRRSTRLRAPEAVADNFAAWLRQIALIVAAHAGLVVLIALVAGWPWPRREPAPVIVRAPVDPLARQYVYFFGVVPAFTGTLLAVLLGIAGAGRRRRAAGRALRPRWWSWRPATASGSAASMSSSPPGSVC